MQFKANCSLTTDDGHHRITIAHLEPSELKMNIMAHFSFLGTIGYYYFSLNDSIVRPLTSLAY